eukprot:gene484-6877_t
MRTRVNWLSPTTKALLRRRNRLRKLRDRTAQTTVTASGAVNQSTDGAQAAAQAATNFREAKLEAARSYRSDQRAALRKEWQEGGLKPHGLTSERWASFNAWRGKGCVQRPEPNCSADKVNDAFLGKIAKLRESLNNARPAPLYHKAVEEPFRIQEVTEEEVLLCLSRARATSSSGVDSVPMQQLKRVGPSVAAELTAVVNEVLLGEEWPSNWKDAVVMPLWKKKGCRNDPLMYRPIALLPAIARLTERVLNQQLKQFVHANNLLPDSQHGFRQRYSGTTALLQIVQLAASARDEGHFVYIASLDAAAAFDTVPHERLLHKLQARCGFSGQPQRLLSSYFSARRQCVTMGNYCSGWKTIETGVPQGAVLSPLLYALYSEDIESAVAGSSIVQYADDVTIIASGPTLDEARNKMNRALNQFHVWATGNGIVPEPTKTQLLLSAAPQRLRKVAEVSCNMAGVEISPSDTIRILGVLVDPQFSWEEHAVAAAAQCRNAVHQVRRSARFFPRKDRAKLMEALALPYIDYAQTALALPSQQAHGHS